MAMRQEVNTPLILTIGIVSGLLLVVIAIGLEAWFRWEVQGEMVAKTRTATHPQVTELHDRQARQLGSYGWAPGEGEQAALRPVIPLDEARKILIHLGGKMPATRPANQASAE